MTVIMPEMRTGSPGLTEPTDVTREIVEVPRKYAVKM